VVAFGPRRATRIARRGPTATTAQRQQPSRRYDPDQDRGQPHGNGCPPSDPAAAGPPDSNPNNPIRPGYAHRARRGADRSIDPSSTQHRVRPAIPNDQSAAARAAVEVRLLGR